MLPYHRLQLVLILVSGAVTLGLLILSRRLPGRLGTPLARGAAVAAALLVVTGVLFPALARTHGLGFAFSAIAIGFYGLVLWAPAGTAALALREGRARGARPTAVALACAALCTGTGAYALLVEPNRLVLRRERVPVPQWAEGRRYRIVHVSDLQTVGPCERELRAASWIRELEPDLVVITGDYVAGPFSDAEPAVGAARRFLGALRAPDGVVVVPGHSEQPAMRARVFEGLGLRELRNASFRIALPGGEGLTLHGLDVERPRLPDATGAPTGEFVVAASHEPDLTRGLTGRGIDLHLAGHTHGGQVVLPGLGPPLILSDLPRRYARGLHRFEDHWLHVTAGIGMEGSYAPRFRFLCPPEVTVLDLVGTATESVASGGRAAGGSRNHQSDPAPPR